MDELLAEFLAETIENADIVDRCARRGRSGEGGDDAAGAVFRMTATIGATAQFLDIPRLQAVAAAAESLAGGLRQGRIASTPAIEGLMLAAVRRIEAISLEMMRTGAEPGGADEELVVSLANAAGKTPQVDQINALDSSLRPNMGSESLAESPPCLRLIVGGGMEGSRDETLPDRR